MSINKLFCLVISIILLSSCQQDDKSDNLMVLSTNNVKIDGTTKDGVLFSATILVDNDESIVEQGFIYGMNENLSLTEGIVISFSDYGKKKFSIQLCEVLIPDVTYYVRSYVKTNSHLIYGNEVEFFSNGSNPPKLDIIKPTSATWGDTIMIVGTGFDSKGKENKIYFGDLESSLTWGHNDTIYSVVPVSLNVKESDINVSLYGQNSSNSLPFELFSPVIESISETEGQYPDTITITGKYFSDKFSTVTFGDYSIQPIAINKNTLTFQVPFLRTAQDVGVSLEQLNEPTEIEKNFKYNKQAIIGLSSDDIYLSDTITIYSDNLDFKKAGVISTIDNLELDVIHMWSDSMWVTIPYSNSFDYTKLEYDLKCKLEDYELKEVYSSTLTHKNPEITYMDYSKIGYQCSIIMKVEGLCGNYQSFAYDEGGIQYSLYINNLGDGMCKVTMPEDLIPGKYQLEFINGNRTTGKIPFEVMMPEITSFEGDGIHRGDVINIQGNYLPMNYRSYQLRHTESNRVFQRSFFWQEQYLNDYKTSNIIGEGTYQLEFVFKDKIYPAGKNVVFNDYLEWTAYIDMPDEVIEKSNVCFARDGKLFSMVYYGNDIEIFDINTGEYSKIQSNIDISENSNNVAYDATQIYPTIVGGEVFIRHLGNLYQFNFDNYTWEQINVDINNESVIRTANINDALFIQMESKGVYKLNGTWERVGRSGWEYFTFGVGDYCYSYYNGGLEKGSVDNFIVTKVTDSPLGRNDNYYGFRHLFVYENNMYEAMNEDYGLNIAKYSIEDDSFERLDPSFISGKTYITRFFVDVEGDVYYLVDKNVYKFIP